MDGGDRGGLNELLYALWCVCGWVGGWTDLKGSREWLERAGEEEIEAQAALVSLLLDEAFELVVCLV